MSMRILRRLAMNPGMLICALVGIVDRGITGKNVDVTRYEKSSG